MGRIRRADDRQTVYSTDTGRISNPKSTPKRQQPQARPAQGGPPRDGVVRVSRTSAGRGGKTVTLVTGIPDADVASVAAALKKLCGSGGTVKDGVVEIQGDHRARIVDHLSMAYTTKQAGG